MKQVIVLVVWFCLVAGVGVYAVRADDRIWYDVQAQIRHDEQMRQLKNIEREIKRQGRQDRLNIMIDRASQYPPRRR